MGPLPAVLSRGRAARRHPVAGAVSRVRRRAHRLCEDRAPARGGTVTDDMPFAPVGGGSVFAGVPGLSAPPWLNDRHDIARVALFVHEAMEFAADLVGEEWGIARVSLAKLLLWCSGEGTDANIAGAMSSASGAILRDERGAAWEALNPHNVASWFRPAGAAPGAAFVGLDVFESVRWACAAAASRRMRDSAERQGAEPRGGLGGYRVLSPVEREHLLLVRRRMFLARAVMHATSAAAFAATDPRTIANDLWARADLRFREDDARTLLFECEGARERLPRRTRKRSP